MCEAYRTCNSDLRLLRQLLLEDGFWAIKEAADALYRDGRAAAPSAPATASTGAQTAQPAKAACDSPDAAAEEIRHAGRGTHFVSSWPAGVAEAGASRVCCVPADPARRICRCFPCVSWVLCWTCQSDCRRCVAAITWFECVVQLWPTVHP